MSDKQEIARLRKRIEELEITFRVIQTWASCLQGSISNHAMDLQITARDIEKKCKEVLNRDRDT